MVTAGTLRHNLSCPRHNRRVQAEIPLIPVFEFGQPPLSSLKLDQNVLIFIDGIDVRPSAVDYNDYFTPELSSKSSKIPPRIPTKYQ
jgi:hypothetical protein